MMITCMAIEDYDEVLSLWQSTSGMGLRSLDDSKAGIRKFLERNPTSNFVCRKDGHLVGVILCGHDGRRAYIYHAAVHEKYRSLGIGKALLDAVIEALKKEEINKVALVVYKDNELGNGFWKKHNFEQRDDLLYHNLSLDIRNV